MTTVARLCRSNKPDEEEAQELVTRISHEKTGRLLDDIAEQLSGRGLYRYGLLRPEPSLPCSSWRGFGPKNRAGEMIEA